MTWWSQRLESGGAAVADRLHRAEAVITSSTGLSSRTAAVLAYSGWWVTGAIFWFVERRDPVVRFHAAQSVVVFGTAALFTVVFGVLAVASLSFLPSMFTWLATAAGLSWAVGMLLWILAMWKALRGEAWKVPFAESWAARMSAL